MLLLLCDTPTRQDRCASRIVTREAVTWMELLMVFVVRYTLGAALEKVVCEAGEALKSDEMLDPFFSYRVTNKTLAKKKIPSCMSKQNTTPFRVYWKYTNIN